MRHALPPIRTSTPAADVLADRNSGGPCRRSLLCKHGVFVGCLLALSNPALAWENDVHYGLTRWLAIMVGFSETHAEWIAAGNQGVDDSNVTGPVVSTTVSSCVAADSAGSSAVARNHFPSRILPPSPPPLRIVSKGEPWWDTNRAPFPTVDASEPTLKALGRYLHSLQDSWSHQGEPDIPYSCDPSYAWGHALARGGWSCHLADLTYKWVDSDAIPMAKATYDALLQARGKPAKHTWASLKDQVAEFSRMDNKFSKGRWLEQKGFKNHEEIAYATSLKNCPDRQKMCSFDYAYDAARRQWDGRLKALAPIPASLPKELIEVLAKVGKAMITANEQALRALVDEELAQVAMQRALRINTSCASLYEEQFKWSFLEPFLSAKGAVQPMSTCELAMQIHTHEQPGLTCSAATSEAIKAHGQAQARGIDLRLMHKLGPSLDRMFAFSHVRKAEGHGEGADYWALGYFPHLPMDRLLLGLSRKGETYKVTAFIWQPDE